MDRKYVAFISYRHAELDSAVAKQMHTLIERYVVPKKLRKNGQKKLGIVFRDQEELPVSSDLSDDICRALDNAQYLIVVCTKNTAQSPWVGREISYFLEHHDRNCAFAALAEGEPSEVFPLALTQIHHPDGTVTDVEPLAIDLRADSIPAMKKKSKREIIRLFAALIGCPYDSLVMREQRRKRRQLASIMAVILAVVTGFSAMTLVKNHQIDQKNQELAGMNQTLEDKNLELEEKNDELARQKAEVQMRESELLTEKAFSYLTAEDTQNAMVNALAALPSATEDRPYYALAEQALTTAMGVYNDSKDDYEIFTTVLEQKTPIACYEISPDGTRIMTLDAYGLVTCFDVASCEILWTSQVSDNSSAENMQMFPGVDGKSVVVSIYKSIAAVSWEDGSLLWEAVIDTNSWVRISPDGKTLGYRSQLMTRDLLYYNYAYEFISAETGEKVQRIELGTTAVWDSNDEGLSTWTFPEIIEKEYVSEAFSSDGRYFVANFVEKWSDTGRKDQCYLLLDLQEGTFRKLYRRELAEEESLEKVRCIYFTADGSGVVSVLDPGSNANTAYRVEKLDTKTGKRLWMSDTSQDEEQYFWSGDPMQVQMGIKYLFLSRSSNFYVFDLETGEHLHTLLANEREFISLEFVEDPFFSLVFSDGTYTLGWVNSGGVYTSDYYYGPYLDIGEPVQTQLWNDGILRMVVADGYIQSTRVGTADDPTGYIVAMPQEESRTLEIKRAVDFGSLVEKTNVDLAPADNGYLSNAYVKVVGSSAFALGRFSETVEGENQYTFRLIDRDTYEVTEIPMAKYYSNGDNLYFPSDGSGYISLDYDEGMVHYNLEGKKTVLMENPTKPFPDVPSQDYYTYRFDGRVQTDGRLLTVALGEGKLTWFYDGKDKGQVEIPADIRWEHVHGGNAFKFLSVGKNGFILIAHYAEGEEMHIQSFAAYDIAKATWYRLAENLDVTAGFAGMAEEHPWMVINDDTNHAYIYDMDTGKLLYQFPLQLPLNSVDEIALVLHDEYLAVKTADLQVYLYNLTTGEIVYNTKLEGYLDGMLHVEEDAEHQRVYIWEDSTYRHPGVCLDKESWTELAQIPGLLYYDSLRNKLYCYHSYTSEAGEGGIVFTPPSLEELVEIGEKIME